MAIPTPFKEWAFPTFYVFSALLGKKPDSSICAHETVALLIRSSLLFFSCNDTTWKEEKSTNSIPLNLLIRDKLSDRVEFLCPIFFCFFVFSLSSSLQWRLERFSPVEASALLFYQVSCFLRNHNTFSFFDVFFLFVVRSKILKRCTSFAYLSPLCELMFLKAIAYSFYFTC